MNREIETDIARTRKEMSAQLARLQAIDDPVESIHAALTFEDACREVILDLADVCRTRLDDIASWAQGPSMARLPVSGSESTEGAGSPAPTLRAPARPPARRPVKKRAGTRAVKARAGKRQARRRSA